MKKLAVVLGVAAVATFTGCRDQDYDAKHGKQVQDEVKSVETTPAKPAEVTTTKTVETTTVTTEIKTVEAKCMCAPGTKHATPCACGASDCKCVVVAKPQPVEPETTTYIVQNGDYLAKISKKYNVTIGSIKRINNLKDDKIRVGQKLKLPGRIDVGVQAAPVTTIAPKTTKTSKKSFTAYTGATKEYVVKNGDTLGSVAYGNGCNIRQLKQLNNLTSDSLKIGQKLKVPADKTAKAQTAKKPAEPAKAVTTITLTAPAETAPAQPVAPTETAPTTPAATTDATPDAPVAPADATPAPTADATPAPAAPATTTYVVKEGEDLTRIAVDFGVTPTVIRELNNLGESDEVKPGQVLKLPAES